MAKLTKRKSVADQRKERASSKPVKEKKEYEGNTELMISTGSTTLDLAISGKRIRGGGIPGGILVELIGPNSSGKTVCLVEAAGDIQRKGGEVMFRDPEARLNKVFANIFDLNTDQMDYGTPDTVPQLFQAVRKWEVKSNKIINGIFADSLAALSTDMEMDDDDGDKMGMRRAKEFSEELRRTCRLLKQKNYVMMASNQVRVKQDAGNGPKFEAPGGKAIGFYSSLRLRFNNPEKIWDTKTIKGKQVKKVVGVKTKVEVFKSSVDVPFRTADLYIVFDYGIDDVRANLQYVKDFTKGTKYMVNDTELDVGMEKSIKMVEQQELEDELKEQVIDLWEEIESKFKKNRKKKKR